MAGSMNRATLIGHLGRDPEVRRTQAGDPIVNFRLATSEQWTDRSSGEKKERTEWHTIVIFNESLAKIAEQYLKKGSKVLIEGKIATRKWQDQSGQDRYSTEIVLQNFGGQLILLGDAKGVDRNPDSYGQTRSRDDAGSYAGAKQGDAPRGGLAGDIDDDIPF